MTGTSDVLASFCQHYSDNVTCENFNVQNNIFYGDSVSYGDVEGTDELTESNNLTTDPSMRPDFSIPKSSAAVNAGVCIDGINYDLFGFPRLSGSSCDIGAHEVQQDRNIIRDANITR